MTVRESAENARTKTQAETHRNAQTNSGYAATGYLTNRTPCGAEYANTSKAPDITFGLCPLLLLFFLGSSNEQ